jgi:hypothetical protein
MQLVEKRFMKESGAIPRASFDFISGGRVGSGPQCPKDFEFAALIFQLRWARFKLFLLFPPPPESLIPPVSFSMKVLDIFEIYIFKFV